MDKFQKAIIHVVESSDRTKYPKGMNAGQVLSELRAKESELGLNLTLTTVIDVADELRDFYGSIKDYRPR